MRKLTKWIVCLLVLTLVLSSTSMMAFAAENDALSLTVSKDITVGDSVVVSVHAQTADLVTDGVLVVTYDNEALAYVDAESGSAWSETADLSLADNCKAAEGTVSLAFAAVDAAAKGDIINLEFTALKAGNVKVAIDAEKSKLTGAEEWNLGTEVELAIGEKATTTYTVTFVDGVTKEVISTQTVNAGEAAVAPEVEDHDGYYFLNWDKDFSAVSGDMTVTAIFCVGGEGCPSAKFTDVEHKMWYHESIDYVIKAGYMIGMGGTKFAPLYDTNRAMIVVTLYRMAGSPTVADGKLPFTDVKEGDWFYDAVLWAYTNGIVKGMSGTRFCPMYDLSREQLVTFLYRYAELQGYSTAVKEPLSGYGFTDIDEISPYALDAMSWAVEQGLMNGMSKTTLQPQTNANRAMIAKLIMGMDQTFKR